MALSRFIELMDELILVDDRDLGLIHVGVDGVTALAHLYSICANLYLLVYKQIW